MSQKPQLNLTENVNQDMIDGYLNGLKDIEEEFPARLSNRGAAYRHGWNNGRNDRLHRNHWCSIEEADKAAAVAIASDRMP